MQKTSSIVITLLLSVPSWTPGAVAEENLIQIENRHEGSSDWQLTRVRVAGSECRSVPIEGYCSRQSAAAGES
ncbi:MAG: hypothetical protein ACPGXX_21815, partial [Planctomycetaceae bacterium]